MRPKPIRFKHIPESYDLMVESYVQDKPYVRPLPYARQSTRVKPGSAWTTDAWMGHIYYGSLPYYVDNSLKTRAYEKFRDKVQTYMAWAVNYAERKQAVESLAKRAFGAADVLSDIYNRNGKRFAKRALANGKNWNKTFLEFHFGWIPLATDIYNTVETLFESPPGLPVRVRVSTPWNVAPNHKVQYNDVQDAVFGVGISGLVTVNNPNLLLLNRLGLLNPAALAWELVPYSFVIDWFANINTVISQFTDFAGLNTDLVSYTTRVEGTRRQYYLDSELRDIMWEGPTYESFEIRRYTGIPFIMPAVKQPKPLSVTRGVTAIALLLNKASPFTSFFKPFRS